MNTTTTTVRASFRFHGRDFTDVPVINPGDWFGKSWLVEIGGSYTPLFLIVEADNLSDAIDELSDSKWGHEIHVADCDLPDYPEDDRHYDGNGRVIDTENVMIYGREDYTTTTPFPCLYHDDVNPEGITPVAFSSRD